MLRDQFPLLNQPVNGQPLVYLDNAATSQKPTAVIEAVRHYYQFSNANVHRASHFLSAQATRDFELARERVAQHLNAWHSRELIWTSGTTAAINLVAFSWGASQLKAGDEIILSTLEHHANIVPWQMVAERTGARIRVIPLSESGELNLDAYQQLLNEKTRLVAVTHASNAIGTINPVKAITAMAKSVGAIVLVDGAQALPHFKVDVRDIGCDFYVFSGHKVFAPTGTGALWGREALLEKMPPWQGGGEMIERVSFEGTTFNRLPFKFEAGTPNISGAIGLSSAINWLAQQNRAALEAHESALLNHALDCCSSIKGFKRTGQPDNTVSLLSFTLDQQHQQDIGLQLDQMGIAVRTGHHCAMPLMQALGLKGSTRASFAFYNTLDEVERFATALDKISRDTLTQASTAVSVVPEPPEESALVSPPSGTGLSTDNLLHKLEPLRDWNSRYRELMLLGKNLPPLPAELKTDNNRITGCESNTWLMIQRDKQGIYHITADSDARIIRGLITLVLAAYHQKTAQQITQFNIDSYFERLDLHRHLSPSRGNGLHAIVDKIRQVAEAQN
ncbi:MAG: SufS family cysteine desulfurase [Pontibacterium sp.]